MCLKIPSIVQTSLTTHILRVSTHDSKVIKGNQQLEQQVKAFWQLEALGIHDQEDTIYDQFPSIVKFCSERYEVMLPWKDPAGMTIPDNHELSLKRLYSLLRRLS